MPKPQQCAETLMITSLCSGGCNGCPFGTRELPQRWMGVDAIVERLKTSSHGLVVLTGGEPLEHPEFQALTQELVRQQAGLLTPFRLATGGHVLMPECVEEWARIPTFEGISLGTDVLLMSEHTHSLRQAIWRNNVRGLNEKNIPYSLTLSLRPQHAERALADILSQAKASGARPQFLFLRMSEACFESDAMAETIALHFPDAKLIIESVTF